MYSNFIELTLAGEVVGLVNINQIVSVTKVEDLGVIITLTVGKPITTDMPYEDLKENFNIFKNKSETNWD